MMIILEPVGKGADIKEKDESFYGESHILIA